MQIPRSTLVRITKVCSAVGTVLNPRRELGDESDLICHPLTKPTDAGVHSQAHRETEETQDTHTL